MELGVKQIGWTFALLLLSVGQAVAEPATENARSWRSPNGWLTADRASSQVFLLCHHRAAGTL